MASYYEQYSPYAIDRARYYGVPEKLFLAQINQESGFDPNVRNPSPGSTATGIAQFIKGTAKSFGIDPLDPYQSLDAAAKYTRQLYDKTGSWESALRSYGTISDKQPTVLEKFRAIISALDSIPGPLAFIQDENKAMGDFVAGVGNTNKAFGGSGGFDPSGLFDSYAGRIALIVVGIIIAGLAIWAFLKNSG